MKRSLSVVVLGLLLGACAAPGVDTVTPPPRGLSSAELRLRVLDALHGRVFFCGPPVIMVPTRERLRREIASLSRSQPAVYRAILRHERIHAFPKTNSQLARVDRVFQQLLAIQLKRTGGQYFFHVSVTGSGEGPHRLVSGTITAAGQVTIEHSVSTPGPPCPICLARGVRISTPGGPLPVQDLHRGRAVWTVDGTGHRIRAVVLRTRRVPAQGELLWILLVDGRSVTVSPRHPTASGRLVGQLRTGERLGGSRIRSITAIPYRGFTYDLLPSGPTGDYFADGILLGSTLSRQVPRSSRAREASRSDRSSSNTGNARSSPVRADSG
jgi:hypothetical protein